MSYSDPEEAKRQGSQNAINYLTSLKDAIESYDEAKAKYLVEPDNDRAKDDLIRTRDNLQDILDKNPLTVNLFGNVKKESFDIDISKAISSMEELTKVAGTDYMEFFATPGNQPSRVNLIGMLMLGTAAC